MLARHQTQVVEVHEVLRPRPALVVKADHTRAFAEKIHELCNSACQRVKDWLAHMNFTAHSASSLRDSPKPLQTHQHIIIKDEFVTVHSTDTD